VRRLYAVFLGFLTLAGCATTSLPPVSSKDFAFESDEKILWKQSGEMEESFRKNGLLFEDAALDAYLDGVAAKLAPRDIGGRVSFRIRVLKNPHLNAFALPNGAVFVHTGILARMENEAQLATLLAHEMTHTTHRHAVKRYRDVKNKSAWLATTVAIGGDLGILLGGLGTMASVTGYSRELESEADLEGLKLVVAAGYDPREAPKLFDHMKKEIEEEKIKEPFFFGTHPRLKERIENFESYLQAQYAGVGGSTGVERFLGMAREAIYENARLDLRRGRFQAARREAGTYLSIRGEDARGHVLLGDSFLQEGGEGDLQKAIAEYERAISLDSACPDSYRGLGLIYYKKGDKEAAKRSLERYLSVSPKAPDRGYIEEYLKAVR
jgi:predicted Zn-dependent protease